MKKNNNTKKSYDSNLNYISFHLGGIGSGSIAINGKGRLSQWQIFNQVNNHSEFPDTFFAIWVKEEGKKPIFKILETDFIKYPSINDVEIIGEYPIIYIDYIDNQLPINLRLEAFSPFIPLNSKDSALPAIIFNFSFKNLSKNKIEVCILASIYNPVGYDGFKQVFDKGRVNKIIFDDELMAIKMSNLEIPKENQCYGDITLACKDKKVTFSSKGFPSKAIIEEGRLPNDDESKSSLRGYNGVLAISNTLEPNFTEESAFILSWYFPNHYWRGHNIGNMYDNWFKDSLEVSRYVIENFSRLTNETRLFHETFYDSTLPYSVLDRITANISTINSQTCMWISDGTFLAFEGCGEVEGCCPMNCTHVWNYEQTLARLFPNLERNMRKTDLKFQMDENGMIHHRTNVPLYLPRLSGPATDGQFGTILKVYREHLNSPDMNFLVDYWSIIKKALEYAITEWDKEEKGVISQDQMNTYDCSIYGINSFIGSLYLAALRAAEEMAQIMGEKELAGRYKKIYERGTKKLDIVTWNGQYFIQHYDEEALKALMKARVKGIKEHIPDDADYSTSPKEYGLGCFSDQLIGQWWAYNLGLGYILPKEHVQKALKSIIKYNWRDNFKDFISYQRQFVSSEDSGLLNCTWPNDKRPEGDFAPIHFCDEVWTGVEYQVASHLIYEGFIEEGEKIVKSIKERYNGKKRNPWSEIECGEHYARAMSSYSLLTAYEGFIYNGPRGIIGFKLNVDGTNFKAFFSTAEGWGSFSSKISNRRQVYSINLKYGRLNLSELILQSHKKISVRSVRVYKEEEEVKILWTKNNREVNIKFYEGIEVRQPQKIKVILN